FADQIAVYLERALEARTAHGDTTAPSPIEPEAAVVQERAPAAFDSTEAPPSDVASGVSYSDVASGASYSDVASGASYSDVASGFSRKEKSEIEPEWPARVEAAIAPDAAVPAVDFWEPWQPAITSPPIEEPAPQPEVETPVLLEAPVPVGVVTAVEDATPLEAVAAVEREVETDLTGLVDAIAEPVVDPGPEVVEMPQPVPAAMVPEAPAADPSRPTAAKPANRRRRARPAPKDDWRFFDPEETRFAALLAKLDEITSTDVASHSPRPRA
ncbi:MAG TPA: hypothetical protein VIX63_08655, partial [Vicinamibacterales bacterium]